jgi:hypothetical protein
MSGAYRFQRLCYVLFKSICKEYVINGITMKLEQANNNQVW